MLSFATKWVNVFSTPSSYNKLKEMEQKQRFGPNLDSFLRHEKWTNVWFNFLNAYCFIMDYKKNLFYADSNQFGVTLGL